MKFKPSASKVLNTLFDTFGQPAQLIFRNKTTVEVLVIHRFPDKVLDLMESHICTETNIFEVRLSEILSNLSSELDVTQALSQIVTEGKTYTIQGESLRDQHGLVLRIQAYAS